MWKHDALPQEMRPTLLSSIDGTFASVLAGFLLVELTGAAALAQRPLDPSELVELALPIDRPPAWVLPPTRPVTVVPPPPIAAALPKPASSPRPGGPPPSHERVLEEVRQRGALGLLAAKTGSLSNVAAVAIGPTSPARDLEAALAHSGGRLELGHDPLAPAQRKNPGSHIADSEDVQTEGGALAAPLGREAERASRPQVRIAPEPGDPPLPPGSDPDRIAAFVRTQLGRLQACYEHELKLHPDLHGRLAIRFVVGVDGRVSDADIEEDSLGSDRLDRCLILRIDTWQLSFKPRDETAVVFPFIFAPSSG